MKEYKQNFIRKIQIKNYKSIKDLTVEFHTGLNIIIGPNGTGKTNFVNAVNSVFRERLHADLPIGFEFSFEFVNAEDEIITWSGGVQEKILKNGANAIFKNRSYYSKVTCGTAILTDDSLFGDNIFQFFLNNNAYWNLKLLSFGHPVLLPYVYANFESLKVSINEYNYTNDLFEYIECDYFSIGMIRLPSKITLKTIQKIVKIQPALIKNLANFSPIKNCRISEGYTFERTDKALEINHIVLEFYVEDLWISWDKLSDGTKRLFYIISETLANYQYLLIEEPELGIHPDQLYKLMDFLKEQAQHKQIIITTHSPDVLNILENNELHKIVVTRIDKANGTLMHHLSPQKVKKGQSYMQDLSLKDFWVHSNLEALDETAEN